MIKAVHINSIEDFNRDCEGNILISLSTVYIVESPLSLYVRRKRKVKRFNKARYQKVLLSIKGIKPC